MAMGISEAAALQILSGAVPGVYNGNSQFSKSNLPFVSRSQSRCRKRNGITRVHLSSCSSVPDRVMAVDWVPSIGDKLYRYRKLGKSQSVACQCQQSEGITQATDESETWYMVREEKVSTDTNGSLIADNILRDTFDKLSIDSVEEEAWNLLREPMLPRC